MKSVLLLLVAACSSPKMPSEAEAKAAAENRASLVDLARSTLLRELGKENLEGTGASPGQRASERAEKLRALNARIAAEMTHVVEHTGMLGLRVEVFQDADRKSHVANFHVPPCPPGRKNGSVEPRRANEDATDALGWGLYQTAWSDDTGDHGNGDYHPGIVVETKVTLTDRATGKSLQAEITACFLTDGTPRPK